MSANISTKPLTDTQFALLSAAAQRADRALVLPERLKGNAAQKTAEKLIGLGLVDEIRGEMPVWRRNDDGRAMTLRITKRGLKMIAGSEDEPKSKTKEPPPTGRLTTKMRPAAATARSDEGDLRQVPPTKPRGRVSATLSKEMAPLIQTVCAGPVSGASRPVSRVL